MAKREAAAVPDSIPRVGAITGDVILAELEIGFEDRR
jgi:hypothetical protein